MEPTDGALALQTDHGRTRELEAVAAGYRRAIEAGACAVLVTGEPGIGKSWLLATAARRLLDQGARVLEGYALDLPGAPPAFALAQALNDAVAGIRADPTDAQLQPVLGILATAGIGQPRFEPSAPRRDSSTDDQLRVFDALAAVLTRLARDTPLVVVLDDMQWASALTWDALRYCVRALGRAPVFFVLAARDEVMRADANVGAEPITELLRLRLLTHVPIAALAADGMAGLAADRLGGDALPELVAFLVARSEGNPFFAEELLAGCLEQDLIEANEDGWTLSTALAPERVPVPDSLRLAIEVRLARLPRGTEQALAAGATLGREFSRQTLAAMSGADLDAVADDLAPAVAAGIVDPTAGGWRFRHDTVREAVLARHDATAPRLHRDAARALASELGHAPGFQSLAALAHHWLAAGEPGLAAPAALAAAEAAMRSRATREALDLARTGRDAFEQADSAATSEDTAGALVRARLLYGTIALAATAYDEADEALRAAVAGAAAAGDAHLEGRAWLRLGTVQRRRERTAEAADAFGRAIALLEGPEDVSDLGEALVAMCDLDGLTRARYAEARAAGERAREIAETHGDRALAAQAALVLANVEVRAVDPLGGRPLLLEALDAAIASGDRTLAAEVCAALSNTFYWTGELRQALRYATQRLEIAESAGDLFALRHARSWLAFMEVTHGEWERARVLIAQAESELERLDSPEPLGFVRIVDGFLQLRIGDLDRACDRLEVAVTALGRIDDSTLLWYAGLLALAYARAGRTDAALEVAAAQELRLQALPESALPARSARAGLGLVYALLGDLEAGARCEAALRPYADDYHWCPVRLTLAGLAALRGDNDTARLDLDAAEAAAQVEGRHPDLALIHLQRAQLLPRREAGAAAEAARDELSALGMPYDAGLAEALLPSIRREPGPGGLSPRELEVLRLLAGGQTNREIADTLVISERTAVNHVSHIFDKLGLSNRAEAASWAARHGL